MKDNKGRIPLASSLKPYSLKWLKADETQVNAL